MEPYNDAAVAKIEERVDDHGRRLDAAEKRLDEQDKRLDSIADLTASVRVLATRQVPAGGHRQPNLVLPGSAGTERLGAQRAGQPDGGMVRGLDGRAGPAGRHQDQGQGLTESSHRERKGAQHE